MGQYYTLYNHTRHIKVCVGKFYGDFDYYVKLLGWSKDDDITAYGDYGAVMYMTPKAPTDVREMDAEGVWAMCVFAAKKLGISPEDFYTDFLHDDSSEVKETPYVVISFSELIEMQETTSTRPGVA